MPWHGRPFAAELTDRGAKTPVIEAALAKTTGRPAPSTGFCTLAPREVRLAGSQVVSFMLRWYFFGGG